MVEKVTEYHLESTLNLNGPEREHKRTGLIYGFSGSDVKSEPCL